MSSVSRSTSFDQPASDGLLGHVVRLNVAVDRVLAEVTGAHGISVADYLVLGVIRRSPQHRSAPTAICEVLGRTTGGMTLTIDRLVRAKLVRRLPDPGDRRRVVVEATAAGVALAKKVNADLHGWEQSLGATRTQTRGIVDALGQLTDLIDAGNPTP
ncbi:MAG: MarR family transcriptional regulator [Actinobacteria bacterium]|nr:MarR family transcriptional regulator [Actinomycetota bacterium]